VVTWKAGCNIQKGDELALIVHSAPALRRFIPTFQNVESGRNLWVFLVLLSTVNEGDWVCSLKCLKTIVQARVGVEQVGLSSHRDCCSLLCNCLCSFFTRGAPSPSNFYLSWYWIVNCKRIDLSERERERDDSNVAIGVNYDLGNWREGQGDHLWLVMLTRRVTCASLAPGGNPGPRAGYLT